MSTINARAITRGNGSTIWVEDIKWHFKRNGPWRYTLSKIYYEEEVENEVKKLRNWTKSIAA